MPEPALHIWEPEFIQLWQQGLTHAAIAQQLGMPVGTRMVKKPEHSFVAGVTYQPSSNFRLADKALYHAYSTPIEDSNGGG